MVLRSGYILIAQRLQEAADAASHAGVREHLSDAVRDAHRGSGQYAHYMDHTGDGKAGDVIYSVDGDTMSAPYSIATSGQKQTASIDKAKAAKVIAVVSYKKQMTAAEADVPRETSNVMKLTEAIDWTQDLVLAESIASGVEREIKIIAPGKGSSAFYTEAALKGSGPGVFKSGTQMFINHATRAEESERPEGDWRKLVGALTSDAIYHEAHQRGPGLYAKAKFVSNLAPEILEKAPFSGLSIRANGRQALEAGRPSVKDGLPVLAEFTNCESIDLVTKAGAGGMILTESQRAAGQGESMQLTQEQLNQLRESGRMALAETARRVAIEVMGDVSLAEAGKEEVIRRVLANIPTKEGWLDTEPFRESVKAEVKAVGAFLARFMPQGVRGQGGAPVQLSEADEKKARKDAKRMKEAQTQLQESRVDVFADILGDKTAAKFAAEGRGF